MREKKAKDSWQEKRDKWAKIQQAEIQTGWKYWLDKASSLELPTVYDVIYVLGTKEHATRWRLLAV